MAADSQIHAGSQHHAQEAGELRQKVKLLHDYLESSIADIAMKRRLNQTRATNIKVLILCLSGGATLLLGLDLGKLAELPLKNLAFAATSILTVLNALEPFFNYRALWVEHEKANAAFFAVKDRLNFYIAGRQDTDLNAEQIGKLYAEYEAVWAALNNAWSIQRQKYAETPGATKA